MKPVISKMLDAACTQGQRFCNPHHAECPASSPLAVAMKNRWAGGLVARPNLPVRRVPMRRDGRDVQALATSTRPLWAALSSFSRRRASLRRRGTGDGFPRLSLLAPAADFHSLGFTRFSRASATSSRMMLDRSGRSSRLATISSTKASIGRRKADCNLFHGVIALGRATARPTRSSFCHPLLYRIPTNANTSR